MERRVAFILDNNLNRGRNLQRVLVNTFRWITFIDTLPPSLSEEIKHYFVHLPNHLFVGQEKEGRLMQSDVPPAWSGLLRLIYATEQVGYDAKKDTFFVSNTENDRRNDESLAEYLSRLAELEGGRIAPYDLPSKRPPAVKIEGKMIEGLVRNSCGQEALDHMVYQIFPYARRASVRHLTQGLSSSVPMLLNFDYTPALAAAPERREYVLKITPEENGERVRNEWLRYKQIAPMMERSQGDFFGKSFPKMFVNEDGFEREFTAGPAGSGGWLAVAYQLVRIEGRENRDMHRLFLENKLEVNLLLWLEGIYALHKLQSHAR